jgi:lipopolysaccharide export system protein LptA
MLMKRLAAAMALATTLVVSGAQAQIAGGGGPIDVTADELEMLDSQKTAVWRGNVEALQGQNRLLSDVLHVYFSGGGSASTPAGAGEQGLGKNWGDVQRMVAEGKVFFLSPTQTARGDRAVYEVLPDTITMTGDVVVVQGENVVKGNTLVIHVKTGQANFVSTETGRNKPNRVRGVFYSNPGDQVGTPAAGAPAAGAPAPAGGR